MTIGLIFKQFQINVYFATIYFENEKTNNSGFKKIFINVKNSWLKISHEQWLVVRFSNFIHQTCTMKECGQKGMDT